MIRPDDSRLEYSRLDSTKVLTFDDDEAEALFGGFVLAWICVQSRPQRSAILNTLTVDQWKRLWAEEPIGVLTTERFKTTKFYTATALIFTDSSKTLLDVWLNSRKSNSALVFPLRSSHYLGLWTEKVLNTRLTMQRLRVLIYTHAADHLTDKERDVIASADTHSRTVADRHYLVRNRVEIARKADELIGNSLQEYPQKRARLVSDNEDSESEMSLDQRNSEEASDALTKASNGNSKTPSSSDDDLSCLTASSVHSSSSSSEVEEDQIQDEKQSPPALSDILSAQPASPDLELRKILELLLAKLG